MLDPQSANQLPPPALFPSLSWFWREILNDHSAAVLHAARNHCSARSLILSVREERRGPADTQHPAILRSPSQTHTFTSTQINIRTGDRRQTDKRGVEKHPCRKGNSPGWGWAMDLGLGLARVERGTISCPSASEKSTLGTRANIFPPR